MKINRILGSVLGLALGDAFGAPFEGGVLERTAWAVIGTSQGKRRFTDDTQMNIDVMESLVEHGRVDQDDLAQRFAASYHWSRGYGPGAAKLLKRIASGQHWETANRSVFPDGSFGNGGAMRAPVVGLFYADAGEDKLAEAACDSAAVTHAHPLGQEGAVLIALATALAHHDTDSLGSMQQLSARATSPEFAGKLQIAKAWLESVHSISQQTVASELGNGIAAVQSCVTAVYIALRFRDAPFNELLEFTIKLGGDVDTIAAMAGAIWGAALGVEALPGEKLEKLEQCERLMGLARSLAE